MAKQFGLALVLMLVLSVACMAATPLNSTMMIEKKEFKKSAPPPATANKDAIAAEVEIRYPVLSAAGGANPAVDTINKAVESRLLKVLGETEFASPEKLMESFFQDYAKTMKEQPDMPGAWSLKFEGTIRHADEDLCCLEILVSLFQGGAHPNSNIEYLVFSLKTGETVSLSQFVPDANMAALTAVAEKEFRKVRTLKPEETYEAAGFSFKGNTFALNRNFLVSKDGLAFCFNAYEIGPYALGVTEMTIPWSEIKALVDPKGPAARFLN